MVEHPSRVLRARRGHLVRGRPDPLGDDRVDRARARGKVGLLMQRANEHKLIDRPTGRGVDGCEHVGRASGVASNCHCVVGCGCEDVGGLQRHLNETTHQTGPSRRRSIYARCPPGAAGCYRYLCSACQKYGCALRQIDRPCVLVGLNGFDVGEQLFGHCLVADFVGARQAKVWRRERCGPCGRGALRRAYITARSLTSSVDSAILSPERIGREGSPVDAWRHSCGRERSAKLLRIRVAELPVRESAASACVRVPVRVPPATGHSRTALPSLYPQRSHCMV
jgi:hypothetical protein